MAERYRIGNLFVKCRPPGGLAGQDHPVALPGDKAVVLHILGPDVGEQIAQIAANAGDPSGQISIANFR